MNARTTREPARWFVAILLAGALALAAGCRKQYKDIPPYDDYLMKPSEHAPSTPMTLTEVGRLDPRVGALRSIAIDGADRIYACGAAGIRVLGAEGAQIAAWSTPADAWAIAVGDDGTVYVGLAARVLKYDPAGKEIASWEIPATSPDRPPRITSIAVRGENVYVADAGSLCIHRYATNGDFIADIGKRDPSREIVGIITPSPYLDVVVDGAGRLVVGNPGRLRVETYARDGRLLDNETWGEPGLQPDRFEGCCNPTNLALTREGYVVTSEKGIPRVKVSDRAGKLLAYLPPMLFPASAAGIDLAVDSRNRIYVAEPVSGKIWVYELKPSGAAP
jgi:sugar lactone lactonase YvrE